MVDQNANNIKAQFDNNSFKEILFQYGRIWYWFFISVFLTILCALIYLRYAVPEYSVSSTVLIKDDKKSSDLGEGSSGLQLDIFQSAQNINNEVEILKGKRLMRAVLENLSLQTSCYSIGTIKTTELYGKTLPIHIMLTDIDSTAYQHQITMTVIDNDKFEVEDNSVIKQYRFGEKIKLPYATFIITTVSPIVKQKSFLIKFNDIKQLGLYYNSKVDFNIAKDASVLTLTLVDPVPQKAQDILNKLVDEYKQEAVDDKNLIANNTVNFIDGRLKYLLSQLTGVEKNVEKFKKNNQIIDVATDAQNYVQQSNDYSNKLNDWNTQISVLNSIEEYLNKKENKYNLVPSSLGIQDPTLNELISKFNGLQLERNRLLRNVQEQSPLITGLNDQLSNLRANILESLKNIKQGLVIARNNIQKRVGGFQSQIGAVPSVERGLTDIKREQAIKETLYAFLLQKREESAISLASTVSNIRVIDQAYIDDAPVKPKNKLILLIAFAVGIILPMAYVYIKGLLDIKVRSISDINKFTGDVTVLGELSHNATGETLVINSTNRSEMAERIRLIRSNLQFTSGGLDKKVLMVTSSRSGEGKTFFSINFAASLALTGKKVVLLEFDIRKPKVLKDLKLGHFPNGITNYLVDPKLSIDDILHPLDSIPGMSIAAAGPVPPNPSELLLDSRLSVLIQELKERFDYVVIDTSPIGQVSDAFTLGKFADVSFYMVRYDYTYKEQLNIVKDIHNNKKMNNLLIIMNDAKKKNGGYGYGYGYGYGGYGGYGVDDQQGAGWLSKFFKKK